jgi:hypothetical protein
MNVDADADEGEVSIERDGTVVDLDAETAEDLAWDLVELSTIVRHEGGTRFTYKFEDDSEVTLRLTVDAAETLAEDLHDAATAINTYRGI